MNVKCPYCGEEQRNLYADDFDWEGNDSTLVFECSECRSLMLIEAQAVVTIASVGLYAESELHKQMAYEAHCDDLVDLHRDREMGFE